MSLYANLPKAKVAVYSATGREADIKVYGTPTTNNLYKGFSSAPVYFYTDVLPANGLSISIEVTEKGTNSDDAVSLSAATLDLSDGDAELIVDITDNWDITKGTTLTLTMTVDSDSEDAASYQMSASAATLTFTVSEDTTTAPVDFSLNCDAVATSGLYYGVSGITYSVSASGTVKGIFVTSDTVVATLDDLKQLIENSGEGNDSRRILQGNDPDTNVTEAEEIDLTEYEEDNLDEIERRLVNGLAIDFVTYGGAALSMDDIRMGLVAGTTYQFFAYFVNQVGGESDMAQCASAFTTVSAEALTVMEFSLGLTSEPSDDTVEGYLDDLAAVLAFPREMLKAIVLLVDSEYKVQVVFLPDATGEVVLDTGNLIDDACGDNAALNLAVRTEMGDAFTCD